jgi:LacI family transcriptional regulator
MKNPMPRVALLIETSREYGRGLLRGVIRYQREHRPWSLYFQPKGLRELPAKWLRTWHGDGILVRADDQQMADAVAASGVPAVELRFALPDLDLPCVGIDNRLIVEMAVRHLLERGFRHLGFCGLPRTRNIVVDYREQVFAEQATQAGVEHRIFSAGRSGDWESEQQAIVSWLAGMPKPVGVLAGNDDRGLQVLDACRRGGMAVPDEVAVVGIDNDEFLCNLATPPLSSVDVGVERAGYEAASLLERMMAGRKVGQKRIFLPPIGVVVRQSTDVMAIPDRELARIIRDIRERACEGLRVEDVMRESSLSASTLVRRFKELLGRTPKEEITRVQLDKAKQLLAHTDMAIADIATKCGFAQPKRLSMVFRGKVGSSPLTFRRQSRPMI